MGSIIWFFIPCEDATGEQTRTSHPILGILQHQLDIVLPRDNPSPGDKGDCQRCWLHLNFSFLFRFALSSRRLFFLEGEDEWGVGEGMEGNILGNSAPFVSPEYRSN